MWKYTQRSWVGGRLDAELAGRQDLAKYFQGASELKNFLVRRQGYIAKRAGTELVCKITGDTISSARLIPLSFTRESGYAILLVSYGSVSKAFLVSSSDGVADGGIDIPYTADEFSELNYTQSGDTVFIAHRKHPPAKFVHRDGRLEYKILSFLNLTWNPPRIISITASGTWGTASSTKTVSYVATYVKDGIESIPSDEFQFSYQLPWGNTCALHISIDKGENETEPDHYNLYKKDSVGFGLITTSTYKEEIVANPELSTKQTFSKCKFAAYSSTMPLPANPSKTETTTDISSILNRKSYFYANSGNANTLDITDVGRDLALWRDSGFKIEFGEGYGKLITEVSILLDFMTCAYEYNSSNEMGYGYHYRIGISSKHLRFRMYLKEVSTGKTFNVEMDVDSAHVDEVNNPNTGKPVALSEGTNNFIYKHFNLYDKTPTINSGLARKISVSFTNKIKAMGYSDAPNGESSTKKQISTVAIEVLAFSDEDRKQPGVICLQGISFGSTWKKSGTYTDDYITPDTSLTPPKNEPHFDSSGEYPACVALYQQRLVFASSENEPSKFWMSCVGDLYNFNTRDSVREDDALSAELSATEFPDVNHAIVGRDLLLFTSGGEWIVAPVSGNTLTYKTVSAKLQSALGCSQTLKPILVGDEILFAHQSGSTILATRYNYTSDGYESNDLSVMSQWIFRDNPIVQMAYRQHPDSTIECVLKDGTIASLVYMKEHEVCAWSRHILGGGWKAKSVVCTKAISSGSSEILYLVERDGEYALWRIRDDVPIRDANPDASAHICLDGLRTLGEGETAEEGETTVAVGGTTYAGYTFAAKMTTVRPEPQGSGETVQFEIKNAKDAEIRVLDSGDFTVRAEGVPESLAVHAGIAVSVGAEDGTVALATRDVRKVLAGRNGGDGRVTVESETPWPLNVLSLSVNYEIQPLSGSEG